MQAGKLQNQWYSQMCASWRSKLPRRTTPQASAMAFCSFTSSLSRWPPVSSTSRELTRNTDSLTSVRAIVYARGMPELEDLLIRRAILSEQKELEDLQL